MAEKEEKMPLEIEIMAKDLYNRLSEKYAAKRKEGKILYQGNWIDPAKREELQEKAQHRNSEDKFDFTLLLIFAWAVFFGLIFVMKQFLLP